MNKQNEGADDSQSQNSEENEDGDVSSNSLDESTCEEVLQTDINTDQAQAQTVQAQAEATRAPAEAASAQAVTAQNQLCQAQAPSP